MNNSTKLVLELLRDYIQQVSSDETIRNHIENVSADIDWEHIFKLSRMNNVMAFVYNQVKPLSEQYGINPKYTVYMKNIVIYRSSDQIRMYSRLNEIIDAFEREHIDYYVLKGVILADLYPNPEYRYSCDIDIHTDESQLDKSMKALEITGCKYKPDHDSESDYKFTTPENQMIELHVKLFDEFDKKHKDTIDRIQLDKKENITQVQIQGRLINTLKPSEFLIYLICHLTVHFISTGINIRYLMDMSVYVNKYLNDLDFGYIMEILYEFGLKSYTLNLFHVCRNYLGMNKISIEIPYADDTIIEVLLYDILEKHLNYDSTKTYSENNYDKMYGRLKYYGDKKNVVRNMIFPSVKSLKAQYAYAKHHTILLPIAWFQRLFRHFFGIVKGSGIKGNVDKVKDSVDRVHLLEQLDLLK